ncbi:MAG: hypothetical protein U0175_13595 [Caldilineaceae bacterium]
MNKLFSKTLRIVNSGFVAALLLTSLPFATPSVQAATSAMSSESSCTVSGVGPKLFLPMVANGSGGAVNVANAPAQVAATPRTLRYQVGKTYSYHYDLAVESQSVSQDGEGSQTSNGQALGVIADVDVAITAQNNNVFTGNLVFRNTQLCNADVTGVGTTIEDDELLKALAQPILFKQKSNGTISEVSYEAGAPDAAVNLQKGVLNSLQVTLQSTDSYEVEEQGGQGSYKVHYTVNDSAEGLNIARLFNQDSFLTLLYAGDDNQELQLQNSSSLLLDAALGVIKSVNVNETIVSAEQSQPPVSTDGPADGASATSGAETRSLLSLSGVSDSGLQAAAQPNVNYVVGGLGAAVSDEGPFRPGIDLTTVDLNAELAALETAPDDPALVERISDLIDNDEGTTVLDTLATRMSSNSSNDEISKGYVDVLGVNGTPQAQVRLLTSVQFPYSLAVQEHALIGIITLRNPQPSTVQAVQNIANDANSPLHDLALLVLGGLAETYQDPTGNTLGAIKQQLREGLRLAATDDSRILYLDAIGNSGDASALSQIEGYLAKSNAFALRMAAIESLRKFPASDVEERLVTLLNDTTDEPEIREIVANVLRGRVLSESAAAALAAYDNAALMAASFEQTNDTTWKKSWNKHLGGNKFGINLPGSVNAAEKLQPERNVSLVAEQKADAHAWSFTYNVAKAEMVSKRNGDHQDFHLGLYLLNNKIKKEWNKSVQCDFNKSANVYKKTHTLIDFSQKIPVWAIINITIGIRATGSLSLDYSYDLDVCNPLHPFVSGSITPAVNATLEGYAAVSIEIVRAGASVSGTLLNTSLPAKLTAKRDDKFELCMNITVKTKPLTIAVKIFAERRKLTGGWKRFAEKTIFKYETPQKNYALLDKCLK